MKRTIKLKNATVIKWGVTETEVVVGQLAEHDDVRQWSEGTHIRSSAVVSREGNKVETLNTIYILN